MHLVFQAFQRSVAHFSFCLVRIKREGWCTICQIPNEQQNKHHPHDCVQCSVWLLWGWCAECRVRLPLFLVFPRKLLSGGGNLLPKFMPISFFRREPRLRCLRTSGTPIAKNSQYILECNPDLSLTGLKLCELVSRSDLILISFWMLTIPLREAKPGGFPLFLGKGPDCVADPFGTVPRRCS